jgi:hypothetical protein
MSGNINKTQNEDKTLSEDAKKFINLIVSRIVVNGTLREVATENNAPPSQKKSKSKRVNGTRTQRSRQLFYFSEISN